MFCCMRSFSRQATFFRMPILRRMLCSQKDNNMNNDKLWTIPNGLCFTRIAASPIIFDLVVTNHHVAALFLVTAAETTDLVDGYIARRWPSQQSNIGSVLDPLADKILVTFLFLSLGYAALIPVPLTLLVVGKDLYLIGASINVRYKNTNQPKTISRFFNPKVPPSATISPNLLGKLTACSGWLCSKQPSLSSPCLLDQSLSVIVPVPPINAHQLNCQATYRIAASPIIFHLVVTESPAALFLVAAAGSTDLVDGYIARRWPSQQSNIGSVLDPLADKILVTTVFLSLSYVALIPVPLTLLVVGKDLYLIDLYQLMFDTKIWINQKQYHDFLILKCLLLLQFHQLLGKPYRYKDEDIYASLLLADDECSSSECSADTGETYVQSDIPVYTARCGWLCSKQTSLSSPCLFDQSVSLTHPVPPINAHHLSCQSTPLRRRKNVQLRKKRYRMQNGGENSSVHVSSDSSDTQLNHDSPAPRKMKRPDSLVARNPPNDNMSLASDCSASLRLAWEEPAWNESAIFGDSTEDPLIGPSPAPSEISEIVADCGMADMFEESEQQVEKMVDQMQTDITDILQEATTIDTDITDLLHRSHCMQDSRELYRSVVLAASDFNSEIGSLSSFAIDTPRSERGVSILSTGSIPAVNIEPPSDSVLLDDSYHTEISTDFTSSPLTEEENSSGKEKSKMNSSMVDSAISTDMASGADSSEPETPLDFRTLRRQHRRFDPGLLAVVTPEEITLPSAEESEKDKENDELGSCSFSMSERSMEWDEMRQRASTSTTNSCALVPEIQVPSWCSGHNVDVDVECSKFPIGSRDLMVYAREQYSANTSVMKVLHQLYKRRRLRRILQLHRFNECESVGDCAIRAFLNAIAYNKLPIFHCQSFQVVNEAIEMSLKRCRFLLDWQFNCNELIDTNKQMVPTAMIKCLKRLWDLHEMISTGKDCSELLSSNQEQVSYLCESVKILMVLKALEVYEQTLFTRQTSRPFYAQLFVKNNPKEIMQRICDKQSFDSFGDLEMALLSDALCVRVELFRLESSQAHIGAVYPDKSVQWPSITLIQDKTHLYMPLLHIL